MMKWLLWMGLCLQAGSVKRFSNNVNRRVVNFRLSTIQRGGRHSFRWLMTPRICHCQLNKLSPPIVRRVNFQTLHWGPQMWSSSSFLGRKAGLEECLATMPGWTSRLPAWSLLASILSRWTYTSLKRLRWHPRLSSKKWQRMVLLSGRWSRRCLKSAMWTRESLRGRELFACGGACLLQLPMHPRLVAKQRRKLPRRTWSHTPMRSWTLASGWRAQAPFWSVIIAWRVSTTGV